MNSSARTGLPVYRILLRRAAPILAAGLLAAACGGGSSSTASSGASTGAKAGGGQSAFLQCLRKNGLTLPAGIPTSGGGGQPPSGGQLPGGIGQGKGGKAFQACRKLAPAGFRPGGAGGSASAIAAFASCMKSHGVTLSGTGISALTSLSRQGGKTGKAFKTCQPLLPSGFSG